MLKFAHTHNTNKAKTAFEKYCRRGAEFRGFLLYHGKSGAGKTRFVEWLCTQKGNLRYWRLPAKLLGASTMRPFYQDFYEALTGTVQNGYTGALARLCFDYIARESAKPAGLTIIIDEIDIALNCRAVRGANPLIEALREVTDRFTCNLILIGGAAAKNKILQMPEHIESRMWMAVEFDDLNKDDKLNICAVQGIEGAAAEKVAIEANKNARQLVKAAIVLGAKND